MTFLPIIPSLNSQGIPFSEIHWNEILKINSSRESSRFSFTSNRLSCFGILGRIDYISIDCVKKHGKNKVKCGLNIRYGISNRLPRYKKTSDIRQNSRQVLILLSLHLSNSNLPLHFIDKHVRVVFQSFQFWFRLRYIHIHNYTIQKIVWKIIMID